MSDIGAPRACWVQYFEQLYMMNALCSQLPAAGLQKVDADPPSENVKEVVARFKGGKSPSVCNIGAELLKAGGPAMICAVLTAIWQSETNTPDWLSLSGRKRGPSGLQQLLECHCSVSQASRLPTCCWCEFVVTCCSCRELSSQGLDHVMCTCGTFAITQPCPPDCFKKTVLSEGDHLGVHSAHALAIWCILLGHTGNAKEAYTDLFIRTPQNGDAGCVRQWAPWLFPSITYLL